MNEGLWDTERCAQYLGVSTRQFDERVSKTPGFPAPYRFPTVTGGKSKPRWESQDIFEWVKQHREAA